VTDPEPTPLEQLAAFAREHDADMRAAEAKRAAARQHDCERREAAEHAARAYAKRFTLLGDPPPPLDWTGYPNGSRDDLYRIEAVVHLGTGIFLAYRRYRPETDDRHSDRAGVFTLVAAERPDREHEHGSARVEDMVDLAESLGRIKARSCAVCRTPLAPTPTGRTPRTYCSGACRAHAYRRRAKAKRRTT
jgi:hypothetical protein